MSARYAVYWTPEPDEPLWTAGCEWLGRDPRFADAGFAPPLRSGPWRYGFHATLKAPMHLRDGVSATAFIDVCAELAHQLPLVPVPSLKVGWLGDFIALRPERDLRAGDPLYDLAAACVCELDRWRARPAQQRSSEMTLNAREAALQQAWGYPFVLDCWRLHLSLSDQLDKTSEEATSLFLLAQRHFQAALMHPCRAVSLAVFEEPQAGVPLRLLQRVALGTSVPP